MGLQRQQRVTMANVENAAWNEGKMLYKASNTLTDYKN